MTRPLKGVGRVASELADSLIELHESRNGPSLSLALPNSAICDEDAWPSSLLGLEKFPKSAGSGHVWEQFELPRLAKDRWLLNLCNTAPLLHSKQVVMIHDAQAFTQTEAYSLTFQYLYRFLLPILARRARILLTVSDYSRRELETLGVFPRGKAHVVHNGVDHFRRINPDPNVLARNGLTTGGFFLALGSLAPHKNLKMLVKAARARPVGAIPLIIAGGQNSRIFRDEGLSDGDGVRFIGRVSDGELKSLYKNARALAFPSITEGFGLPPLEAMSCGCPVIASTGGAIPEVCGEAALYVNPFSPDAWTTAMTDLETNDVLRTKFIERGQMQSARFTWHKSANRILELISEAERDDQVRT